ncbi:MAG: anhydro-N-acetylmuramic acid kinase [bacterium]
MTRLSDLQKKNSKLAIGLMSGTSLDGVDAALVKIESCGTATKLELLDFLASPYPPGLKKHLLEVSSPDGGTTAEICRLNVLLGEIIADAALALLKKAGKQPEAIDFIGSHGQTVCHLPHAHELFGYKVASTLQLGEPSVISKRTGIVTVADFRPADMACGGEGAPLVPYFDFIVFRSDVKNRGLLNIGGIGNLTVLPKQCLLENVMAFDTGPGNMLIDGLMQRFFQKPYDENGDIARTGTISQSALAFAMQHPYFNRKPPKSTGREEFGRSFLEDILSEAKRLRLPDRDVLATVTALTARSIRESYDRFVAAQTKLDEIIVSGGGSLNTFLLQLLQKEFNPVPVKTIDEFGVLSGAKEAMCFAVLANETLLGKPSNTPRATGANRATILGKICF